MVAYARVTFFFFRGDARVIGLRMIVFVDSKMRVI